MAASPLLQAQDQTGMLRDLGDRLTVIEQTAIVPVGLIAFCPFDIPNGWLLCDGSTISQARYGQLVAYLKTTTLPDLGGALIAGYDPGSATFGTKMTRQAIVGSAATILVVTLVPIIKY